MKNSIVLSIFLLFASNCFSQDDTVANAINRAGYQATLTQRVAKNYILLGVGSDKQKAAQELKNSVKIFERNYTNLVPYIQLNDLGKVSKIWREFVKIAETDPSITNATILLNYADDLAKECDNLMYKIISESKNANKSIRLVATSSKQRLNLERLAMLYCAKKWGVNPKSTEKNLAETIQTFDIELDYLKNAKENNDNTNRLLEYQTNEWAFLKKTIQDPQSNLRPTYICNSTSLMLTDFDRLTLLYETVAN